MKKLFVVIAVVALAATQASAQLSANFSFAKGKTTYKFDSGDKVSYNYPGLGLNTVYDFSLDGIMDGLGWRSGIGVVYSFSKEELEGVTEKWKGVYVSVPFQATLTQNLNIVKLREIAGFEIDRFVFSKSKYSGVGGPQTVDWMDDDDARNTVFYARAGMEAVFGNRIILGAEVYRSLNALYKNDDVKAHDKGMCVTLGYQF